ncbi:MAG: YceI family protein [Kiloniellales bacterium]
MRDLLALKSRSKSLLAAGLMAATLSLAAPTAQAAPEVYKLDPRHTSIAFLIHHIGYYDVAGQFLKSEGSFTYDQETNTLSKLQVTIDAASIFSNDEPRDKHVRGKDFLHVEQFPEITFTMTEAKARDATSGTVTGDLTILGVSKPVTLEVTLNKAGDYPFAIGGKIPYVLGITAESVIKRSDFGMDYAVANGWVGDDIEIFISFEAVRQ